MGEEGASKQLRASAALGQSRAKRFVAHRRRDGKGDESWMSLITSTALLCFCLAFSCLVVVQSSELEDASRLLVKPQDTTVELGRKASFFCKADGNPIPSIRWFRNGKDISQSRYLTKSHADGSSTLRIEPVRSRDNDTTVTCSADNAQGSGAVEASARLLVLQSTELPVDFPKVLEHPRLKAVEKGRTARMACRYAGSEPMNVTWIRDLLPVNPADKRFSVSTIPSPGYYHVRNAASRQFQGTLLIANASEADEGKYECMIRNQWGVAYSKTAHLYVKIRRVPPQFSIPPLPVYEVRPGGSVNLSCTAVGYPMPSVFWRVGFKDLDTMETAPIGKNTLLLQDVRESKNYTCVAVSNLGNIEVPTFVSVKALPPQPNRPKVLNVTAYSISLEWNLILPTSDIKHYIVEYRPKFADGIDYLESDSVTSNRTFLTGLEPFTQYEIRLIAVNSVGRSPPSYPLEVTTNETIPESPPLNVKGRALDVHSVSLSFDTPAKANGEITHYTVYYTANAADPLPKWHMQTLKEGRVAKINNLVTETMYVFRVSSSTAKGEGPLSAPVQIFTKQGVPGQPINLRVVPIGSDKVSLSWTEPIFASNTVAEYVVRYNSSDDVGEKSTGNRKPELTIGGLKPDTVYSFQVTSVSPKGSSAPSLMVTQRTKASVPTEMPESVTAFPLHRGLKVIWDPPAKDSFKVESYRIRWEDSEGDSGSVVQSADKPNSVVIENLQIWTEYEISVAAGNALGFGPEAKIAAKTGEDVPGPPQSLKLTPVNATAVRLKWMEPLEANGDLVAYYVFIDELSEDGELTGAASRRIQVPNDKTEIIVSGLKSNKEYSFRINAVNRKGDGEATLARKILVPGEVPSVPQNVEISSIERTVGAQNVAEAVLNWDAPEHSYGSNIERYKIQWGSVDAPDALHEEEVSGPPYRISGLQPGRKYVFRIGAENAEGVGILAEKFLVTESQEPSGPPINLRYEHLLDKSISLTWEPPEVSSRNGNITQYQVEIKQFQPERTRTEEVVRDAKLIIPLVASDVLEVRVRAATSKGFGPFSPWLRIEGDDKDPTIPFNIKAQALSSSSVVVYWKPITNQSSVVGYKIRYSSEPVHLDKWKEVEVRPASADHVVIENLNANEIYAFKGAIIWAKGSISKFSQTLQQVKVDPIHVVTDLDTLHVTKTSVALTWDFSRRPATYKVTYRGHKKYRTHDSQMKEVFVGPISEMTDQTSFTFSNLRPYTNYTFSVAVQQSGHLYWPASINVTTMKDAPPFVVEPQVNDDRTSSGVTLTLQPASEEYGLITEYWVIVVPKGYQKEPQDITIKELLPSPSDSGMPEHDLPWVAAAMTADELIAQPTFMVGTGQRSGQFTNYRLRKDVDYRTVLRAFIGDTTADQFSSSSYSREFRVWSGTSNAKKVAEGGLWIIGPIVAILIIGFIVAVICIFLIRRNKKKTSGKSGQISKVVLAQDSMEASKLLAADSYTNGAYGHNYNNLQQVQSAGDASFGNGAVGLSAADHSVATNQQTFEGGTYDPIEMRRMNANAAAFHHMPQGHPPIPVTELALHIERLRANDNRLFSEEYESIETGGSFTWENSGLEVNRSKNRYANVVAYDHSLCKLTSLPGILGSDYINANFIHGYQLKNQYIATQGPLPETFGDFWRLIWEQRTIIIVMLTRLEERSRVKCDQYWPSRGTILYGGCVSVSLASVVELAHYTTRTFHVQRQGDVEVREVKQMQFTAWPDHGVPDHPTNFLMFLKRVKSSQPDGAGPIVVHCSAGVGRSGAYIATDIQLERLRYESTVDIYGTVSSLRSQRQYMCQTEDQYIFIYEAVLDAVQSGCTEVPVSKLYTHIQKLMQIQSMEGISGMDLEFRSLASLKLPNAKFTAANAPCNKSKNRLVNVLPYDSTRVCLSPIPEIEGSDYVNASFIDGYRQFRAYIATQAPLEETVVDFWRMIGECSSTIIVSLTKPNGGRDKCFQYWPADRPERFGAYLCEPIALYNMPSYVLREFKLTDTRDGQSKTVRHFQYQEWPDQGVPKSAEFFIEFIGQVHKTREQFGQDKLPITVHCSAGCGRTGVFIACAIILERMRYECVCDVFTTVKLLRTQRPNMVSSEDQYQFCYQTSLEYLGSFDHFAPMQ